MTMRITFFGPKDKRREIQAALMSTIKPYVNGSGIEIVQRESDKLDVKVEGAELIASARLETMLREQIPRTPSQ